MGSRYKRVSDSVHLWVPIHIIRTITSSEAGGESRSRGGAEHKEHSHRRTHLTLVSRLGLSLEQESMEERFPTNMAGGESTGLSDSYARGHAREHHPLEISIRALGFMSLWVLPPWFMMKPVLSLPGGPWTLLNPREVESPPRWYSWICSHSAFSKPHS